MPSTISLLNGSAIALALSNFGDATGFVQILEANDFEDWSINSPIITVTAANNLAGDTVLVLPPTQGIAIGMSVYCPGFNTYGLVTLVQDIFQTPAGIPFAQGYADIAALFPVVTPVADTLPSSPIPVRIMPGLGQQVSTNVTVAPALDNLMAQGSTVTFAIGTPTTVIIPTLPPGNRGTP